MDEERPPGNPLRVTLVIVAVLAFLGAGGFLVWRSTRTRDVPSAGQGFDGPAIPAELIAWEQVAAIPVPFGTPAGIAVGSDGSLAIAGSGKDAGGGLYVMTAVAYEEVLAGNGQAVAGPAVPGRTHEHQLPGIPSSVDADPAGGFIVGMGDRVLFCAADGSPGEVWPSAGQGVNITAAARFGDAVWVADAMAIQDPYKPPELLRLSEGGRRVRKVTGEAGRRKHWLLPLPENRIDLCVLDDELAVANPGQTRIEFFGRRGEHRGTAGRAGEAYDGFTPCHNPMAMAVLEGRLVTAERGNQRIKLVDRSGAFVEGVAGAKGDFVAASGFGDIIDLAVDGAGRILALDITKGQVRIFARRGAAPAGTPTTDKE